MSNPKFTSEMMMTHFPEEVKQFIEHELLQLEGKNISRDLLIWWYWSGYTAGRTSDILFEKESRIDR